MKTIVAFVIVLVILGAEGIIWKLNPLHVPDQFLAGRALGVQLFRINGSAMEPAQPAGEQVLVSCWAYWGADPQMGDIAAFVYPRNRSIADLKRVLGVGGTSVEIRNGIVYVDGTALDEPYRQGATWTTRLFMPAVKVPSGSYFVLGDNRDESEDSRNYGVIARADFIGKKWR